MKNAKLDFIVSVILVMAILFVGVGIFSSTIWKGARPFLGITVSEDTSDFVYGTGCVDVPDCSMAALQCAVNSMALGKAGWDMENPEEWCPPGYIKKAKPKTPIESSVGAAFSLISTGLAAEIPDDLPSISLSTSKEKAIDQLVEATKACWREFTANRKQNVLCSRVSIPSGAAWTIKQGEFRTQLDNSGKLGDDLAGRNIWIGYAGEQFEWQLGKLTRSTGDFYICADNAAGDEIFLTKKASKCPLENNKGTRFSNVRLNENELEVKKKTLDKDKSQTIRQLAESTVACWTKFKRNLDENILCEEFSVPSEFEGTLTEGEFQEALSEYSDLGGDIAGTVSWGFAANNYNWKLGEIRKGMLSKIYICATAETTPDSILLTDSIVDCKLEPSISPLGFTACTGVLYGDTCVECSEGLSDSKLETFRGDDDKTLTIDKALFLLAKKSNDCWNKFELYDKKNVLCSKFSVPADFEGTITKDSYKRALERSSDLGKDLAGAGWLDAENFVWKVGELTKESQFHLCASNSYTPDSIVVTGNPEKDCKIKSISSKFSCKITQFHLPQYDLEENLIEHFVQGIGDPYYIAYFEKFPEGEEAYWQSDYFSWNIPVILASGAINFAMGPGGGLKNVVKEHFAKEGTKRLSKETLKAAWAHGTSQMLLVSTIKRFIGWARGNTAQNLMKKKLLEAVLTNIDDDFLAKLSKSQIDELVEEAGKLVARDGSVSRTALEQVIGATLAKHGEQLVDSSDVFARRLLDFAEPEDIIEAVGYERIRNIIGGSMNRERIRQALRNSENLDKVIASMSETSIRRAAKASTRHLSGQVTTQIGKEIIDKVDDVALLTGKLTRAQMKLLRRREAVEAFMASFRGSDAAVARQLRNQLSKKSLKVVESLSELPELAQSNLLKATAETLDSIPRKTLRQMMDAMDKLSAGELSGYHRIMERALPAAAGLYFISDAALDGDFEGSDIAQIGFGAAALKYPKGAVSLLRNHKLTALLMLSLPTMIIDQKLERELPVEDHNFKLSMSLAAGSESSKGKDFDYPISEQAKNYHIELVKDGSQSPKRFHLVSPCKTDLYLKMENSECRLAKDVSQYDIWDFGQGPVPVKSSTVDYTIDELAAVKKIQTLKQDIEKKKKEMSGNDPSGMPTDFYVSPYEEEGIYFRENWDWVDGSDVNGNPDWQYKLDSGALIGLDENKELWMHNSFLNVWQRFPFRYEPQYRYHWTGKDWIKRDSEGYFIGREQNPASADFHKDARMPYSWYLGKLNRKTQTSSVDQEIHNAQIDILTENIRRYKADFYDRNLGRYASSPYEEEEFYDKFQWQWIDAEDVKGYPGWKYKLDNGDILALDAKKDMWRYNSALGLWAPMPKYENYVDENGKYNKPGYTYLWTGTTLLARDSRGWVIGKTGLDSYGNIPHMGYFWYAETMKDNSGSEDHPEFRILEKLQKAREATEKCNPGYDESFFMYCCEYDYTNSNPTEYQLVADGGACEDIGHFEDDVFIAESGPVYITDARAELVELQKCGVKSRIKDYGACTEAIELYNDILYEDRLESEYRDRRRTADARLNDNSKYYDAYYEDIFSGYDEETQNALLEAEESLLNIYRSALSSEELFRMLGKSTQDQAVYRYKDESGNYKSLAFKYGQHHYADISTWEGVNSHPDCKGKEWECKMEALWRTGKFGTTNKAHKNGAMLDAFHAFLDANVLGNPSFEFLMDYVPFDRTPGQKNKNPNYYQWQYQWTSADIAMYLQYRVKDCQEISYIVQTIPLFYKWYGFDNPDEMSSFVSGCIDPKSSNIIFPIYLEQKKVPHYSGFRPRWTSPEAFDNYVIPELRRIEADKNFGDDDFLELFAKKRFYQARADALAKSRNAAGISALIKGQYEQATEEDFKEYEKISNLLQKKFDGIINVADSTKICQKPESEFWDVTMKDRFWDKPLMYTPQSIRAIPDMFPYQDEEFNYCFSSPRSAASQAAYWGAMASAVFLDPVVASIAGFMTGDAIIAPRIALAAKAMVEAAAIEWAEDQRSWPNHDLQGIKEEEEEETSEYSSMDLYPGTSGFFVQ